MDTVASMSLNCNLLCENVQNKAAEFASNEYIQAYYTKSYKADAAVLLSFGTDGAHLRPWNIKLYRKLRSVW